MSDWQEVKLADITEVVTKGTTPSTLGGGFTTEGVNFIKSEAVGHDGRIDKNTFVYITDETNQKLKRSQLQKDDILFSMAGIYLGKNAIVTEDILPANTNQALAIIRLKKKLAVPKYISYFLRQNGVVELINNMSGQSAQPNINFEEIKSIDIKLPSLTEQTSIAEILSSLDDKIDLLHRQNKTLEQLAETLFRQWFVEEAEESWEYKPLIEICEIINGFAFKSDDYKEDGRIIIRTMNFEKGYVNPNNVIYLSLDEEARYAKFQLKRFDFLLVMVGASIGKFAIVTTDILPALQNQNMWNFRTLGALPQHYLNFALRSIIKENLSSASGSARDFFQKGQFYKHLIPIPNELILNKFKFVVEDLYSKIENNRAKIRTLSDLRDALLPKLMSGEVVVNLKKS